MIAAEVIRCSENDYSKANLRDYQRKMELRFGERFPAPGLMERLPLSVKKIFARSLMKTRWFTQNTVIRHWFLQERQAPMPPISE